MRRQNWPGCIINHSFYLSGWGNFGDPLPPVFGNYHGRGNAFLFLDGHAQVVSEEEALEEAPARHWETYPSS